MALAYVAPHSLDEFVRWHVLVRIGDPKLCDEHGGEGFGIPQYLDITDEAGEISGVRTRHCVEHVLECE
jgi:hypothetical protein